MLFFHLVSLVTPGKQDKTERKDFGQSLTAFSEYWHSVMDVTGQVLQSSATANAFDLDAVIKQSQEVMMQLPASVCDVCFSRR